MFNNYKCFCGLIRISTSIEITLTVPLSIINTEDDVLFLPGIFQKHLNIQTRFPYTSANQSCQFLIKYHIAIVVALNFQNFKI